MKTCETCRHFYINECRKHPPRVVGDMCFTMFPAVDKTMWCSEHEMKDERRDD